VAFEPPWAKEATNAVSTFASGVGNVIELTDALYTDVNARSRLLQARADLASARARLAHGARRRAVAKLASPS
jgi:hypothetical protein